MQLPMMIHVTAPATLPAGYTFEALINDDPAKKFVCEVVRSRRSENYSSYCQTSKTHEIGRAHV